MLKAMKEPKQCGRRELHALFTRLATIIDEHSDNGDDTVVDEMIEPIVERFIAEYYSDGDPVHLTTYLLVWFMQWRLSRGNFSTPAT
jgi:hypothetical protein